jgi:hypothetical protein
MVLDGKHSRETGRGQQDLVQKKISKISGRKNIAVRYVWNVLPED